MTSKIIVNNIEADAGISTVTFGSDISASKITTSSASEFSSGLNVTSGNVGIGTDNPTGNGSETSTHIHATNYPVLHLTNSTTGTSASDGSELTLNNDGSLILRNRENSFIRFDTNGSERFRIASDGALGIAGANYGTSGQVLTSQGSGSAPQWATPSSGLDAPLTASASGVTAIDKNVPSGTRRITLVFYGVSTTSGSGQIEVRLGTSSAFIDSGYKSSGVYINAGNGIFTKTSGWQIWNADAAISWSGTVTITNTDDTSLWAANWTGVYDTTSVYAGGGTVNVSNVTRIRCVVTGVGNFDGGTIGYYFE